MNIKLFYIGDHFYPESSTSMSSIYKEDKTRYDYGFLQRDLEYGHSIEIRQATNNEIQWANKKLKSIKNDNVHTNTRGSSSK